MYQEIFTITYVTSIAAWFTACRPLGSASESSGGNSSSSYKIYTFCLCETSVGGRENVSLSHLSFSVFLLDPGEAVSIKPSVPPALSAFTIFEDENME